MFDFPNSPTLNQEVTSPGGVTWIWDGTVWNIKKPIVIPDAPADGTDYVRNNNVWVRRSLKQKQNAGGVSVNTFVVPTWASRVKLVARLYPISTTSPLLQVKPLAGAYLVTAGDYSLNGWIYDTTNGFTPYNGSWVHTGMLLAANATATTVPIMLEATLDLKRTVTGGNFALRTDSSCYSSVPVIQKTQGWIVSGKTSALSIEEFRINSSTGNWGTDSYIEAEWIA